ncbi:MAG: hypothetical protein ACK5Q5_13950 [Planctomycetaceae bacterium]
MDLLFDLSSDIGERRNFVCEQPNVLTQTKRQLRECETKMDALPRTFVVR